MTFGTLEGSTLGLKGSVGKSSRGVVKVTVVSAAVVGTVGSSDEAGLDD